MAYPMRIIEEDKTIEVRSEIIRTVRMNEMPHFYVGKLLLHHYRSDLAHISDLYNLVIELYKSER